MIKKLHFPCLFCVLFIISFVIKLNFVEARTIKKEIIPITEKDFIKPIWHPDDIIINAGELGRYRFSAEITLELPENVTIRPALIKLLNDIQQDFNTPVIIMSGYLSQQQSIYLWAKWMNDHTEHIKALNEKGLKSWGDWVWQSQQIPGCFQIVNKHQTGDAVDFYWQGLDFQTTAKRDAMSALINAIGGSRKYSDAEREKYNIPEGDNNILKVIGYMPGEKTSLFNPWGYSYFHVEYQPSEMPPKPDFNNIGKRLSSMEDAEFVYKKDEIILIEDRDYLYIAKVMEDSHANNLEVKAYIMCDEIRKRLGETIPKSKIFTRRTYPKDGWGTRKVILEYFYNGDWIYSTDVVEFEDYFVIPNQDGNELKVTFQDVRFPVPRIH